ncbi:MAG: ankyrin repeat domain-containing protein [Gammaproteobacteria bacterium]
MQITIFRCFFAAAVLAGLFAIIGGAAFADGDLSALHYVASFGHSDILLSFAVPVSVLHLAVKKGDIAEVKRLIADGANVNAKDNFDMTPLHWAAHKGKTEIADALIKAGANVFTRTNAGFTALNFAERHGENSKIACFLRKAMGWQNAQ